MQYGDEYGELFGDAIAEIETHTIDAIRRLVYGMSNAVEAKKLLTIYTDRIQALENIFRGITPEMLFDLETAYGKQLDQLGSILCLPREGWTDAVYRVYLRTQALLILPDRRSQKRLLQVARSLINNDVDPIYYAEFRPKSYVISVGGTDLLTLSTWVRFLERCRPATYNAQIIWIPATPFGFEDAMGLAPDTCYPFEDGSGTIVVGGNFAAIVPIGP